MDNKDRDRDLEREAQRRDRAEREDTDRAEERSGKGKGWAIAGIISGVAAALLIPILFGPLGVILGIVGLVKGSRPLGITAIVVSILGTIVGLIIGAIIVSMFGGQPPEMPQQ